MIEIIAGIVILGICNGGRYEDTFLKKMSLIFFVVYILTGIIAAIFY